MTAQPIMAIRMTSGQQQRLFDFATYAYLTRSPSILGPLSAKEKSGARPAPLSPGPCFAGPSNSETAFRASPRPKRGRRADRLGPRCQYSGLRMQLGLAGGNERGAAVTGRTPRRRRRTLVLALTAGGPQAPKATEDARRDGRFDGAETAVAGWPAMARAR